jgi:hypothetical protein
LRAHIVLAAIVAKLTFWNRSADAALTKPVIAVLTAAAARGRFGECLVDRGTAGDDQREVAGVSAIDVVPPVQVSAVVAPEGARTRPPRSRKPTARDLARRVGASLVAHGSLARDGQNYVLDLTVHDVRGALIRNFVLNDANPLFLADQAAQRISAPRTFR